MIRKVTQDDLGRDDVFWAPGGDTHKDNRVIAGSLVSWSGLDGVVLQSLSFKYCFPASECFIEIEEVKPIETLKFVVEVNLDYDNASQNGNKIREALRSTIRSLPLFLLVPAYQNKMFSVQNDNGQVIGTWMVV